MRFQTRASVYWLLGSLIALAGCDAPVSAPAPKPPNQLAPLAPSGSRSSQLPEDARKQNLDGANSSAVPSTDKVGTVENATLRNSTVGNTTNGNSTSVKPADRAVPEAGLATSKGSSGNAAAKSPTLALDKSGTDKPWIDAAKLPYTYWEAQYLNAQLIGLTRFVAEASIENEIKLVADNMLQSRVDGRSKRQQVRIETLEHPNGQLKYYSEVLKGGTTVTKTEGPASGGKLMLQLPTAGPKKPIVLDEGCWGPHGVQQILIRNPIAAGEQRVCEVFVPQLHQKARVTLVAGELEDTTTVEGLLTGVRRVDAMMELEKEGILLRMWVDAEGNICKTVWMQGTNLSFFRISNALGERLASQLNMDLVWNAQMTVRAMEDISQLAQARRAEYQITSKEPDPHLLFSRQGNQLVIPSAASSATVVVHQLSVDGALPAEVPQVPPDGAELQSSDWINAEDTNIIEFARQLAGDETQSAPLAVKLVRGVSLKLGKRELVRDVATAKEALAAGAGDCSAHAVLLAAVLRSQKVPARIAGGVWIQNADGQPRCRPHVWTEAWVGDRWLPLDAMTGQIAGCDHLKFAESAFNTSNPYIFMTDILSKMVKLECKLSQLDKS